MDNNLSLETWQLALIGLAAAWELVWKGLALWRAARNDQPTWFVIILIFNTVGILPIAYLLLSKNQAKTENS